jgi:plastocyanin
MVLALGAAAVIIAGVGALAAGPRAEEKAPGAVEGANVAVVASGTRFDINLIDLPARQSETLKFVNRDRVFHNIGIYLDQNFTRAVFNGTPVDAATIEYTLPALDPGTYYFHCDFHPTMQGKVDVK